MNSDTARIKEIFVSTQGEGPYIGYRQLFIRFCDCNLKCKYCDTDYSHQNDSYNYTSDELAEVIKNEFDLSTIHSISLTGGEPLLHSDFIKNFIPKLNTKYYLETNATLANKLIEVSDMLDIVSADIKLPSATGICGTFEKHDKFFNLVRQNNNLDLFAKVVFDETISDEEIVEAAGLAEKYAFELILQPKSGSHDIILSMDFIDKVFTKFLSRYKNVRLIPQVHKFLDIR